ncbi:hypothetical protein N7456_000892 [Penicillium angulare]|uniref:Alpha-ketoglutarate-dependent dioxygenase AlkB-like domain-containing protein n=1 Tax=Penicillium angulare TaxID=116970 RepID=A0A9W9GD01_9EURO|nr:hypothetical protein N7456_000892 [Penicillium angulare]
MDISFASSEQEPIEENVDLNSGPAQSEKEMEIDRNSEREQSEGSKDMDISEDSEQEQNEESKEMDIDRNSEREQSEGSKDMVISEDSEQEQSEGRTLTDPDLGWSNEDSERTLTDPDLVWSNEDSEQEQSEGRTLTDPGSERSNEDSERTLTDPDLGWSNEDSEQEQSEGRTLTDPDLGWSEQDMEIDQGDPSRRRGRSSSSDSDIPLRERKRRKRVEIECAGEPPAWAQDPTLYAAALNNSKNMPDLSETVGWFHAYRHSTYQLKETGILGILIDKNTYCRYMDDEIIILPIGGGYRKERNNTFTLKGDQNKYNNRWIRAWEVSQIKETIIGVIIGDKNPVLEYRMPHRYNVMDFFMVTDMWYEKDGEYARCVVRLQKIDLSKKSWWAEKGSPDRPIERDFEMRPQKKSCRQMKMTGNIPRQKRTCSCGETYPLVYKAGFMCFNQECRHFWKIRGERVDTSERKSFDEKFLSYRIKYDVQECLKKAKFDLTPELPVRDLEKMRSYVYGDNATKGTVCPKCRRCVPRVFFWGWKCHAHHLTNGQMDTRGREHEDGCTWEHKLDRELTDLTVEELYELEDFYEEPKYNKRFQQPEKQNDNPNLPPHLPYHIDKYRLPEKETCIGTVTHFVSNVAINAKAKGADDLFQALQDVDIGLRRYRFALTQVVPGIMTNNLLKNIGLPYSFRAPNDSQSFNEFHEKNPDLVSAYAQLHWACNFANQEDGIENKPINEMLIIGYLKGQDINWHHDGNGTLGPTIATLCLGTKARMSFRMKGLYYWGLSRSGMLVSDDPVLKGCQNYVRRKRLKRQYLNGELTQEEYDHERRKIIRKGEYSKPPRIIELTLYHGHIVVMNGEGIQKYYEHSVESIEGLRFAPTARHVIGDQKEFEKMDIDLTMGECELKDDQLYGVN